MITFKIEKVTPEQAKEIWDNLKEKKMKEDKMIEKMTQKNRYIYVCVIDRKRCKSSCIKPDRCCPFRRKKKR